MKITNIRTYKMQVPLVRPFRIALGLITHAESCLVEIETDAGILGYGEGSPGPLITGENLAGCDDREAEGGSDRHGSM